MNEDYKLKPCPFCGSNNPFIVISGWNEFDVACDTKGCHLFSGVDGCFTAEMEAARSWNKRQEQS